jgi:hypothetical protein
VNGLSYPLVRALVDEGVLTNDWVGHGAGVAAREEEQRALDDFFDVGAA